MMLNSVMVVVAVHFDVFADAVDESVECIDSECVVVDEEGGGDGDACTAAAAACAWGACVAGGG